MDPETAVAEDNEAEQEPQLEAEAQSADAPEATDPNKPDYFPQKLWGDGVQSDCAGHARVRPVVRRKETGLTGIDIY